MTDKNADAVRGVINSFPLPAREQLLKIRALIHHTAAALEGVGEIEETLKWGEPAYLTTASKSGSTIRLGWKAAAPDECAIYFICDTHLIDRFRTLFPHLRYEGNRAILLDVHEELDTEALSHCLGMALTYHLENRRARRIKR